MPRPTKPLPAIEPCPHHRRDKMDVIRYRWWINEQQVHCHHSLCGVYGPARRDRRSAILAWNRVAREIRERKQKEKGWDDYTID